MKVHISRKLKPHEARFQDDLPDLDIAAKPQS